MAAIILPRKHYTQPQGRVAVDWGHWALDGIEHIVSGSQIAEGGGAFAPLLPVGAVGHGATGIGVGAIGSGVADASNADRYVKNGAQSPVGTTSPSTSTIALYVPASITESNRAIAIRNTGAIGSGIGAVRAGFGQNNADVQFYMRRDVRHTATGVLVAGRPIVIGLAGNIFFVNGSEVAVYINNDIAATQYGYCGGNAGSGNGYLILALEWNLNIGSAAVRDISRVLIDNPWQLFRAEPHRIYSLPPVITIPTLSSPDVIDIGTTSARPQVTLTY